MSPISFQSPSSVETCGRENNIDLRADSEIILGPGVVYGADLAHRNQQLKFIAASLSTKALQSYVPLIVKEAEDYFAKWGQSGVRGHL